LNKFIKKKNLKIPIDKNYTTELLRNRMMNELFHEVVPTILKDDDHNSMNYSIENRSPYLDKDLLGFALTIPPSLLISEGYQKKVLRDASKNILPNKIRLDRQKRGFNASISSLVDLKKKENIDHIFNDKSLINEFVNLKKLKDSINFNDIPNHHSKLIFSILTTEAFLKSNL
jgi:asparagine synthase (glutamine-hydrolysing)